MKIKGFMVAVLLSALCLSMVFSQDKIIDTLMIVLKLAKEDTDKVNTLNTLVAPLRYTNIDTARYFVNYALTLATKLNYEMGIADSKLKMGALCASSGQFDNGLRFSNEALTIYQKLLSMAPASDEGKILRKIGLTYGIIGHNRISQGNYPEGLKYSLLSLNIKEKLVDKNGLLDMNYNIGVIYGIQHNYLEALKYFNSCVKINEELGNGSENASLYNTIGWVYIEQGNHPEALKYCKEALKLAESMKDKSTLAEIYKNFGVIYNKQGNHIEALKYDFAALKNYEETGIIEQIPWIYNDISLAYQKQKKYNIAAEYLNKALALSKEIGKAELIKYSYENWASLDSAQGHYKQSLEHYKLAILYRDSLINNENSKKIVQQQMQYDFDKREDSLKQQQFVTDTKLQVQKKQRYLYWAGLVLLGLLSMFVFQNFRNQKKINELASEAHSKQKAELELQNLQAILNERLRISSELHDEVGATLSGIAMYSHLTKEQMKKGQTTEIEKSLNVMQESSTQMVDKLSDIVWFINPEQDPLEKLIARLEEYAIQMAAIKDIKVKIHVPEKITNISLPVEHRRNIYLFCKEAINNAVKYSNASILELTIKEVDNKLEFSVSDNGKGFDAVMVRRGNGLENMQKRADEIGAKLILQSKLNEGALVSMQCKMS